MKALSLLLLLQIGFSACTSGPAVVDVSSTKHPAIFYDDALQVFPDDLIRCDYTDRVTHPFSIFNARNGFCKISNDSLLFFFQVGRITTSRLSFYVRGDSSQVFFEQSDCHSTITYKQVAYKLILDKKHYAPGDTLHADIVFKGVSSTGGWFLIDKDTVTVTGKIKLKIREQDFEIDRLRGQNNLDSFYTLLSQRPETIRQLDLRNSGLKKIPAALSQCKHLKELLLDDNDLSSADFTVLTALTQMTTLSLQNCHLKEVPASLFQLKRLESLNLYDNALTIVPDSLYLLTALKDLCIGRNPINTLSPRIALLKNLISLETSSTAITVYPDDMTAMKKLRKVYANDTMQYIPAALKRYTLD